MPDVISTLEAPSVPSRRRGKARKAACVAASSLALIGGAGAVALVAGGADEALASVRYLATFDGVAIRSGPGTGFGIIGRVNRNAPLDIVCQVQGGTRVGGNATWDKLTSGGYVSDYFASTPSFNSYAPGLGSCTAVNPPAPANPPRPSTPPTSGRRVGRTQPTNSGFAGQCTWGAKQKWFEATGSYPAISGNALSWANSARGAGWTVVLDAQPRSIVVFQPSVQGAHPVLGHLAWVDSVEQRPDGRYIRITEMNFAGGPGRYTNRVVKDVVGMSYILAP